MWWREVQLGPPYSTILTAVELNAQQVAAQLIASHQEWLWWKRHPVPRYHSGLRFENSRMHVNPKVLSVPS